MPKKINLKKYNHVVVHYSEEGDWERITINGETYYENHVIDVNIWLELIELLTGSTTTTDEIEVPDEWWDKNK